MATGYGLLEHFVELPFVFPHPLTPSPASEARGNFSIMKGGTPLSHCRGRGVGGEGTRTIC